MASEESRLGERVPAAMRIKLKYPDVDTFIQRYSVNISRGGIFIATRTPKPVGTTVRFEFQLATAAPVIRGEGQVIWIKPFDPEQPRRVHGMGVRFTRLDPESRALIDRALEWKKAHEKEPPPEGAEGGEADLIETSGGLVVAPEVAARAETPSVPPAAPERSDTRPQATIELGPDRRDEEPPPLPAPPAPLGSREPMSASLPTLPTLEEQREIIAELQQSTQSQVVRAAHHLAEMTAANDYFPEDKVLRELLQPVRIAVPESGREAARLLREILDRGTHQAG